MNSQKLFYSATQE